MGKRSLNPREKKKRRDGVKLFLPTSSRIFRSIVFLKATCFAKEEEDLRGWKQMRRKRGKKQPKERKIIAGRYPRLVEMLPVGGV